MSKVKKKSRVFFIAGTDTDVGKTYVSCGLLEAAKLAGFSTAALKPLAAGAIGVAGSFRNSDAVALLENCSLPLSYDELNPICFEPAIAPHIAASLAGRRVNVDQLVGFCRGVIMKKAELTIIEGAGGWKVPVNDKELLSDLVKKLNVPVILVVAMRLGCINHALLSAQVIQADGLELAGWIANQSEPAMPAYAENLASLKAMMPAPLLAEIKYDANFSSTSSCAEQINVTDLI